MFIKRYPTNGKRELHDWEAVDENFDPVDSNFWRSINKGQAEIHMMALAESIYDAMNESNPTQLLPGMYHIPFRKQINELYPDVENDSEDVVKISVSMAARTSYTVVGEEKEVNYENLIALHDRLLMQDPPHSSPFEHCARAMSDEEYYSSIKTSKYPVIIPKNDEDREINGGVVNCELYPQHLEYGKNIDKTMYGWCRNFKGFIPYRYMIDNKINL